MEILGGVFGRMIATQNFGQRPELGGEVEADFMQQTVTAVLLLQHGRKISRWQKDQSLLSTESAFE